MEPLYNRMPDGNERKLRNPLQNPRQRRICATLNAEAGIYFAHRYAGLRRQFGKQVEWDVGDLFDFAKLVEGWKTAGKGKNKINTSTAQSRPAAQVRHRNGDETDGDSIRRHSTQLDWRYNPHVLRASWSTIGATTKNPFTRVPHNT